MYFPLSLTSSITLVLQIMVQHILVQGGGLPPMEILHGLERIWTAGQAALSTRF